jgi:hypothetical protein
MKKSLNITLLFFMIFFFFSCKDKKNDETEDNDIEIFDSEKSDESTDDENGDADIDPGENFEEGPYGIDFGDTAGDFALPLESGEWSFSQNRSSDESYLLIFYRPMNQGSAGIWKTDLVKIFFSAPDNTHFFFLVDGSKEAYEARVSEIKDKIQTASEISGNSEIKKRIHIADRPVREIDSWFTQWLDKHPDFFMGIDRFQKIRSGGMFHSWQSSSMDLKFEFLYKEAELYNFEFELESFVKEKEPFSTVIKGMANVPFPEEGWVRDIYFSSDFPEISNPGNLYIYLNQKCVSPKTCEWDRLQHLYLCEDESSENCPTEIGRWITTYGRSGKWITDISPLIPLFKKGGKYKFRFTVTGDHYINDLDFIFVEDKDAPLSESIIPLYSGTTPFDENYNNSFEEMTADIPASAKKVLLSAYITGHGNGSEAANCAEFCPFESVFYVNGTPFKTLFDNAGTSLGCYDLVAEGVVPNQYGSWPFGRAGWCPGQDAKLITIDITSAVIPGSENLFHFSSFLYGEDYIPEVTDPSGYRAEIPLTSYITIWQ